MPKILNIDILSLREYELLEMLHEGVVFTPNVDHLVRLQEDKQFYHAYQKADWIICDSVILQRISKLLRQPIVESIPGSTFFLDFCNYHRNDDDCRIFILGGKDGVPQKAMENVNRKFGRRMVVGAHSPSFSFMNDEAENGQLVRIIDESRATVLMVCATSPKQELWIARYKSFLSKVRLFMALGATVDFVAGTVKRCPVFLQRLGGEWFYRFLQEPKRMYRRYFIDDPKIFWYLFKQILGIYKNPHDNA